MKIVAIRGKNLASLEGEFMIDFTVEPLCSAGIFAITGSTGAGKSTLLDALCLALFDCTPRMNKAKENNVSVMDVADRGIAQNDSRSILRRGTAEGYSEVDFVALTGEVFRSRWTVRRSRGKVSGSLQKVEMTLTNLTSGVEQQGTKTELLSRISELIGLSFEQFNRSVLLAQGDFATFLKARQPDKAEILEKLTGTEIYSRISASIYERTKRAESEYKLLQERIKGIELLTDEQLQQLSAEKEELQVRLSVSKKKEEALSGKLKWLEEEGRLHTGCIQAEESLSGIRKEIEAARPRYELLARIEQAQDIRDVYMEQRNARKQIDAGRSRLGEIEVAIRQNAALQTSANVQWADAQKELAEFKAYLSQQEPQLDKARALDVQLYGEMKEFFPENAVEYFVSYYDYYQPEAYVPQSDTYIAKDSSINDEIDKLRHSATAALSERNDVIIVASVSCIYGLGAPIDYKNMVISLRPGMEKDRDDCIRKLIDIQYVRNDQDFKRGTFRVRGDVVEVYPSSSSGDAIRVEFFGDEVDRISEIDSLTGEVKGVLEHIAIFPNSHYVVEKEKMDAAIENIKAELAERVKYFKSEDKLLEAQRIEERTNFDIEMMQETGFCSGIENYSRHLAGLPAGCPPYTLMDYFPDDFLIIVDESHITIPQIRGMYAGDQSRKTTLVDYGFRLPSAKDNRPLNFSEFESKISQMLFVSATPSTYEAEHELMRTEQVIRPTGLLDPEITVKPIEGQIDDLISEINKETAKKNKVLVTTLTKRMAEDLTDYLKEAGIRVKYLHADIDTLERQKIIRDMRLDGFDVLVGINLLREGLDIPEISLVAILDADKEGFLRTETSLIQTIGRAARNAEGHVIMYADKITESMEKAISETERRRKIQQDYNDEHGITPQTIKKAVRDLISISKAAEPGDASGKLKVDYESMSIKELEKVKTQVEKNMRKAAAELNFEEAAQLRDKMIEINKYIYEGKKHG